MFDALRLLLRGKGALLVLIAGLLVGGFVRATRATGSVGLQGAEFPGAALETLASTLFLLAVVFGLVAGLLLAVEDRRSGLLDEVQVRPVGRGTYVAGRLLGLGLVMVCGLALLAAGTVLLCGLKGRDLPDARWRVRPEQITIDQRVLAADELGQIKQGGPGRFSFAAGARPQALLILRPKIAFGRASHLSGYLELDLTLELPDGRRWTQSPPPFRPLFELPIRFEHPAPGAPFVIEVEPRNESFLLEVEADSLTTVGGRVPFPVQAAGALLLLLLAGGISAWLAYLCGLGFSSGPASLLASFLILVALGRGAVLDIIAGIGADVPGEPPEPAAGWLRSALTVLTRLVPDLDRFNPAARLGAGEALAQGTLPGALAVSLAVFLATLLLSVLVLPVKER